jgi:hypothetical protein
MALWWAPHDMSWGTAHARCQHGGVGHAGKARWAVPERNATEKKSRTRWDTFRLTRASNSPQDCMRTLESGEIGGSTLSPPGYR